MCVVLEVLAAYMGSSVCNMCVVLQVLAAYVGSIVRNMCEVLQVKNNEQYPYLLPRTHEPASFSPCRPLQHKQRVKCQVRGSSAR